MNPFASIDELGRELRARRFSSVELTRHLLDRIAKLDARYASYITVTEETALAQAQAADERIASGNATALTGIPIAHKDVFCTRDIRTSCGSKMLDNFIAPYDATAVARLAAAGMVTLGKTNMDEFAMGSSTEASFYGPTRNPWDTTRVPGGSSGGSAAAVAAGLACAATGTDTGGSIRQPASFCGVAGLKPTYGRVSRYGMVAFASSLDQGGPFAHTVYDLALMLAAMQGFDPADSTSIERTDTTIDEFIANPPSIRGRRIGWPTQYFAHVTDARLAQCFADARRVLEAQGALFVDVDLPRTDAAIPVYYVIASAEASTNLARYDGVRYGHRCRNPQDIEDLYRRSRREGFGAEVIRRILTGTYALSVGYYDAYYKKAQRIRRLIRDEFLAAFAHVDAILAPTTPNVAFPIGDLMADPVAMYRQDIFTIPASLAGIPVVAMPCSFIDDLPIGMQLMGNHFDEATLLAIGHAFQRDTDWHLRRPAQ